MSGRRYRALGWVGGKSMHGSHGTGRWIAGLLPPPSVTYTYIEPYAGMLGVLLQRFPNRREIVSDLDGDLINWWRVVRDEPEALGELLDFTPGWSASEFGVACRNLDHPNPVYRAYYFTLAVHWVRGNMIGRIRQAIVGKKNSERLYNPEGGVHSDSLTDSSMKRSSWSRSERESSKAADEEADRVDRVADGKLRRRAVPPQFGRDETQEEFHRKRAEDALAEERAADDGIRKTSTAYAERWAKAADGNIQRKVTGKHDPASSQTHLTPSAGMSDGADKAINEGRLNPEDTVRIDRVADGNLKRQILSRPEQWRMWNDEGYERVGGGKDAAERRAEYFQQGLRGGSSRRRGGEMSPPRSPHILQLAERLRDVELETRPAEWFLDYYRDNPNITWYLDPPYPSAAKQSNLYSYNDLNVEAVVELLRPVKGLVAISGYGTEWAQLEDEGWRRHEHKTFASAGAQNNKVRPDRTEVLWTNYDPEDYAAEPNLFG